jgi:hypothetical protein
MTNVLYPTPRVKRPVAVYNFFDRIQAWMKRPVDQATLSRLRKLCGDLHRDDQPAGFDYHYRQRLTFFQPQPEVLRWLAERHGVRINRVKIAIEYIYEDQNDRDNAFEYLHRHLIRLWHGRRQPIRIKMKSKRAPHRRPPTHGKLSGTRYDAGPTAASLTAFYRAEYSRVSGELDALHLEWRAKGWRAVQRTGIRCAADLLRFDHRRFWQRRFRLVDIDPERLGRLIRNRADGTRSRDTLHSDASIGRRWLNMKPTVQEIIDALRGRVKISRALVALPIQDWVVGRPYYG